MNRKQLLEEVRMLHIELNEMKAQRDEALKVSNWSGDRAILYGEILVLNKGIAILHEDNEENYRTIVKLRAQNQFLLDVLERHGFSVVLPPYISVPSLELTHTNEPTGNTTQTTLSGTPADSSSMFLRYLIGHGIERKQAEKIVDLICDFPDQSSTTSVYFTTSRGRKFQIKEVQ